MHRLYRPVIAAGLLAGIALPAYAGVDYCLSDPSVQVGRTSIDVGLYTTDAALQNSIHSPLHVVIHAPADVKLHTVWQKWQHNMPTDVHLERDLPALAPSATTVPVEIDATVDAQPGSGTFFIQVTLPNASLQTASAAANGTASLTVEAPR